MDYYEEPYYEPTIADELLFEYQQKMKDALLESVKYDIENTKSENIRLKEQNEKLRDQQRQVESKERKLQDREKTLESDFFRKKFSEMLKPYEDNFSGYYAESTSRLIRKCKLCDADRKITYTAPNGDILKSSCSCNKSYRKYVPKKTVIKVLNLSKTDSYPKKFVITPEYQDKSEDDYRWNKLKFKQFLEVYNESEIQDSDNRDVLFNSIDECKKYCDWLNKNIKEDEDDDDDFIID